MDLGIDKFIDEIQMNIGVDLTVYNEKGEKIYGVSNDTCITDFNQKYLDTTSNFTLFRLIFKGRKFIVRIDGVGSVIDNYSYLIKELAEKTNEKANIGSRDEFLKTLLLGELGYYHVSKLSKKYGLNEDVPACAMLISVDPEKTHEVMNVINAYVSDRMDFAVVIDENQIGFVKFILGEDDDYRSVTEYAEFLFLSILEETGVHPFIVVGSSVSSILEISNSYSHAVSAFRLRNFVSLNGNVHTFKEYIFIKILEDLPKSKLTEYLDILMDSQAEEIFSNEEMMITAEEFLENNLNVSETSRKLYLHRNTLTYRLDKIEKATGLDVRKFSDAVTFRLISALSKRVK